MLSHVSCAEGCVRACKFCEDSSLASQDSEDSLQRLGMGQYGGSKGSMERSHCKADSVEAFSFRFCCSNKLLCESDDLEFRLNTPCSGMVSQKIEGAREIFSSESLAMTASVLNLRYAASVLGMEKQASIYPSPGSSHAYVTHKFRKTSVQARKGGLETKCPIEVCGLVAL